MTRTAQSMNDPLFRFLDREVNVGSRLLAEIQENLSDVILVAQGTSSGTNVTKQLAKDIHADLVPKPWAKFTSYCTSLNEWIFDFKQRLDQFSRVSINGGGAMYDITDRSFSPLACCTLELPEVRRLARLADVP